jgi:membrane protein implicated in regulation of membrane protease activity
MSGLRNQSSVGVPGFHTREEAGGFPVSRSTPGAWAFALVAIAACCGLPILVAVASGLASISVVAGRYWLLFAAAAALVALVAAVGIARRVRRTGRGTTSKMDRENEDDCCK